MAEPGDTTGTMGVPPEATAHRWRRHWVLLGILIGLCGYYASAYWIAPQVWRYIERHHPALQQLAQRTVTREGIPGDPLNIGFIGSQAQLTQALISAGWQPADPITLMTSLRIAGDSVAHRRYDNAPVSSLYLWGRKQDLAFEELIGGDPRRRHHVRFWQSDQRDAHDRPLWIGAVTLDTRAGVSHRTGQITHHIGADIDQERDRLAHDLLSSPATQLQWLDNFQTGLHSRNGCGDPYFTDGRLALVIGAAPTLGP
ncbi:MAG TPA: LssY C-terminal domain-containing protein [Steroidobacteraceae bacterium]